MNNYEIVCIFDPKVNDPASTNGIIDNLLEKHEATVDNREDMGRRVLAYTVDKRTEGHYWIWKFQMDSGNLAGLSKELNIQDNLLRHLITRR